VFLPKGRQLKLARGFQPHKIEKKIPCFCRDLNLKNSKSQAPNSKHYCLEFWILLIGICLIFGAWYLEFKLKEDLDESKHQGNNYRGNEKYYIT